MSKNKMSICYPYGMGVSCICDSRHRIYKCFSNNDFGDEHMDVDGQAMLSRDDRSGVDPSLLGEEFDTLDLDQASRRGLDERTEIILAATFLVLIILAFIR